MNSGPVSERVYDAIKQRILSRAYRPGERLDPALLAQMFSSSITPIRDALNLLTGQGLVETGTSDGFHIPQIDEPALKDLYAWNIEILLLSVRSWPRDGPFPSGNDMGREDEATGTVATLFSYIARRSSNAEHFRAIQSLNDRLAGVRTVEPGVIDKVDSENRLLGAALFRLDEPELRRRLLDYHRRRQRKAAEIVRAYYRA